MEKIQVYCEQKSLFVNPANDKEDFLVEPYVFTTAPAWITQTYLWQLLVKDGSVKIINSAKDVEVKKQLTKEDIEHVEQEAAEIEEVVETNEDVEEELTSDLEIENYASMSNKELYALCNEKGIKVEAKKTKAYYLEMLANNK